jgi:flagellar hook protein FlgE
MGLYDAMNASVTGMGAQSNYLTNIGQNIANASTIGYKEANTEFSTIVDQAAVGQTSAGGVAATTQLQVSAQGTLESTTSATDLAVSGNGFFVVSNNAGQEFLTRAGSFVPDSTGKLVNAAGYYLMGYSTANGTPTIISNSLAGMTVVNVSSSALSASPTSTGTFTANLPSTDTATTGAIASATTYSEKSSMVMYDDLGGAHTIDLYFQNNGSGSWSVATYNDATGLAIGTAATAGNMTFSTTTGKLTAGGSLNIPVPGGATMTLDLSGMTQLASSFAVSTSTVNGNAAAAVSSVTVGATGTLSYELTNGSTVSAYEIPLASVASPDNLLAVSGNVYSPNILSGQASVGLAGSGQLGTIKSDNLEESTVDIANELTNMIVSQRGYEANSQMFKCGADLMNTLIQMNLT